MSPFSFPFLFFFLCCWATWCTAQSPIVIDPSSCSTNCEEQLDSAISKCKSGEFTFCNIIFSPGSYQFFTNKNYQALYFEDIDIPVNVSAYGATFNLWGLNGAFFFVNITGIVVEGVTINMIRPPFSFGILKSINGNTLNFQVDLQTYPFYPENPLFNWLLKVEALLAYNIEEGKIDDNSLNIYLTVNGTFDNTTGFYSVAYPTNEIPRFEIGNWYILRHQVYGYNGFTLNYCTDVDIHDVTMHQAAGMGSYALYCDTLVYCNISISKAGSLPMSLCADAIHFDTCKGHIALTDSFIEGQGDDGVNIHGDYAVITSIDESRTQIQFRSPSDIANLVGTTLEIRNQKTFEIIEAATVVNTSGNPSHQYKKVAIPSRKLKGAVRSTGSITLSNPLSPEVQEGSFFASLEWRPTDALFMNNYHSHNNGRGNLISVDNVLIQNVTYERQTSAAILMLPDDSFWYESDTVTNLTITNCTFIYPNFAFENFPGDIMIGVTSYNGSYLAGVQVHDSILISHNTFYKSNNHSAIYASVTDGISISDNSVLYYGPTIYNITIAIESCTNIQETNTNCFYNNSPIKCPNLQKPF